MTESSLHDPITESLASIELVSSRIEATFAQVGGQLGKGHSIFQGLNEALANLSQELSCAHFDGATDALQRISGELNGLAEALPAESERLDQLRHAVMDGGALLKSLLKHVGMITIIARSAKIESASLDADRESFGAFTHEAYELGKAVRLSIEGCVRDHDLLAAAIDTAWGRQTEFERRHRAKLGSTSEELTSVFLELRQQRGESIHVAEMAGSRAQTISEVVGRSIISLQTGDSTRQRLDHICEALRHTIEPAATLVPMAADGPVAKVVVQLQAAQLTDTQQDFQKGIDEIDRALSTISSEVSALVEKGRSLHGSREGDAASLLSRVKQSLAHASTLIVLCEEGGRSIDDALTIVNEKLAKFRDAIAAMSNSVIDITLIGMNAGLKAAHLGAKGRAFVVIANEMKFTADQMTGVTSRLSPLLTDIETLSDELRNIRANSDPTVLTNMETVIMSALHEVEGGNDRLEGLMFHLLKEGAEFDEVMAGAHDQMTALGAGVSALPNVARRLEDAVSRPPGSVALAADDEALLDALFARYTMERERQVHRSVLQRYGVVTQEPVQAESDCDIEFF